jgi:UDP-N-acetylglucosamine--N-acetylmuramyl-(pentapeptide) pyrophosphoryl-undecaprenol N-acetylglucosamine transferase
MTARSIIKTFRPEAVIGVGGYASGPALKVATSMGIPVLIQEQNSFPGVTNRLLGKKAKTICVAYEEMDKYFQKEKIILTGNPIRQDLLSLSDHHYKALTYFQLDPKMKTILVIGGSGGARSINESILNWLEKGLPDNVQLVWQTGKYYYDGIREQVERTRDEGRVARIFPFIDRMDLAYSCADLVISRAGAIAISELCIVGKPAILVPSPNVAEDHQKKNAMALVEKNAALMIPDADLSKQLPGIVEQLISQDERLIRLGRNIQKLAINDSADRIADEAFKLIVESPG